MTSMRFAARRPSAEATTPSRDIGVISRVAASRKKADAAIPTRSARAQHTPLYVHHIAPCDTHPTCLGSEGNSHHLMQIRLRHARAEFLRKRALRDAFA